MKLTNIINWGRFRMADGREVNVKRGRRLGRGTDVYFYLSSMQRVLLSDAEVSSATEIFNH
jgi:hypothetical protein